MKGSRRKEGEGGKRVEEEIPITSCAEKDRWLLYPSDKVLRFNGLIIGLPLDETLLEPVKSSIDFLFPGIEDRTDEVRSRGNLPGQHIKGGDACHGFSSGKGKPFYSAYSDSQSRERARAKGDCPSVEFFNRANSFSEDEFNCPQESFRMGHWNIQKVVRDDFAVIDQSNAAARCGGIDAQDSHGFIPI